DPPSAQQSGDLGTFLTKAVASTDARLGGSNSLHPLPTVWSSRLLTERHQSGEYLDGRQALQVSTGATNFLSLQASFTQRLGPPTQPDRTEAAGLRHTGWKLSHEGSGVWLSDDGKTCRVEIVTPH
ncbi:MAG: hypothetical protein NT154_47190, partial [Verrucomicrobia bacterium]|nr:hypothetical protein [Verrucomicrobiota bacterium]